MFISAVTLATFTRQSKETSLLIEPASKCHQRKCSFWHICLVFQPLRLLLITAGRTNTLWCHVLWKNSLLHGPIRILQHFTGKKHL